MKVTPSLNCKSSALVFLFCLLSQINFGQSKINFADITIEQATQRANIENKPIFVDTYAKWCKPCKKMDIVFQDQKLAKFINKNFISVKIDMDKDYGRIMSSRYQIAFLPTILVLDQNGNTKYKIDRLATANELLSIVELTVNGFVVSKKEEEIPAEIFNQTTQATVQEEDSNEKILYVLSPDAEDLPPEILYQEAYFRMELMDGSHQATAEKYIKTQTNWLEEKNIKFIFDFLYDTNTKTFDFFVENKSLFDQIVGKKNADYSLSILINNRLYQGIPRPNFEEASYLYSLIDPIDYNQKAYQYYLSRTYNEETEEFLSSARSYLKELETFDQSIVLKFCNTCLENKKKTDVALCDQSISEIQNPKKNYNYYATIAKLNYILIEKDDALHAAHRAIELAKEENIDFSDMSQLLVKIKTL